MAAATNALVSWSSGFHRRGPSGALIAALRVCRAQPSSRSIPRRLPRKRIGQI